ncbi:hypothetical protein [Siansivirga zeaxanthinifaciens]|jgi:hypothetical protein|uniref:HTH cro/C1-type domain-containing protein n=1 Tax=Siansivirga zeaxanthinifaciens CC-SAMT-1 TaxID=1454006 RepID=A0A0C5WFA2_9FLAO|nr:hypothetical protein [Siansivirga zeaxanthinifaciens]AJR04882.1 hypothetical protein AW14_08055 [Siansivirga zeaxanthinifaciens CC-SAMT-1]MCB0536639.1 hypothetical protein [Bacteroidota bacterium]
MSSYRDRASESGDFKEKSLISHKFIKAVEYLIENEVISSKKEISDKYGYSKSLITLISQGYQDVPIGLLHDFIHDYHLNPDFFFGLEENIYLDK